MKNKLTEVVNKTEIEEVSKTNKMCSCETNVVNDLCSSECVDTCGDSCSFVPTTCRPSYRGGFGLR